MPVHLAIVEGMEELAMSDTPLTDELRELINADCITDDYTTWLEHSRYLERELAYTKHELAESRAWNEHLAEELKQLKMNQK